MTSIETVLMACFAGLLLCCGLCLYRIAKGPTTADRMVALDILGIVVVAFIAIIAAKTSKEYLLDVVLVFAMVSFVGTLALAKYLVGKSLND